MSAAVGLGPLHLAGVSAQLVVSTALALTKADDLGVQTRAVSFELYKKANDTLQTNTFQSQLVALDSSGFKGSNSATYLGVIADEDHTMARIDRATAEPALVDSHPVVTSTGVLRTAVRSTKLGRR